MDPDPEKKNLERVSKHLKKVCEDLGLNKIKTPVMDKDIPKIEKKYNISVNFFGHSGNDIHPIELTKNFRDMHTHMRMHINPLVTSNDEINSSHHYVWIRDFNKLCCGVTKHTSK